MHSTCTAAATTARIFWITSRALHKTSRFSVWMAQGCVRVTGASTTKLSDSARTGPNAIANLQMTCQAVSLSCTLDFLRIPSIFKNTCRHWSVREAPACRRRLNAPVPHRWSCLMFLRGAGACSSQYNSISCSPQRDGNVNGGGDAGNAWNKFVNYVGVPGAIVIVLIVLFLMCKKDEDSSSGHSYQRSG